MPGAPRRAFQLLAKNSANARLSKPIPCRYFHSSRPFRLEADEAQEPPLNPIEPIEPIASTESTARSYRERFSISTYGVPAPDPFETFEQANWPTPIANELQKQGYPSPTPIQAQCWPIALTETDMVAVSSTGSGKTLGFLLPAIKKVVEQYDPVTAQTGPAVLVMAPTRELAEQIAQYSHKFGQPYGVKTAVVVGGSARGPQALNLSQGPAVVIATPGRLIDMLQEGYTTLANVKCLVLDEADRMLDMGFGPQIQQILAAMPDHQTLMFSATWPKGVQAIAQNYMKEYAQVTVGGTGLTANKAIVQKIEFTEEAGKRPLLVKYLEELSGSINKVLIFVATKTGADMLSQYLHQDGWPVFAMHGDKRQNERTRLLDDFRSGRQLVMIATDVASRGIDVVDITCVINYDFPNTVEDYVHRIGRTARGARTGTSITFLTNQDSQHASELITILKDAGQPVPQQLENMTRFNSSRYGPGNTRFGSGRGRIGHAYRGRTSAPEPPRLFARSLNAESP